LIFICLIFYFSLKISGGLNLKLNNSTAEFDAAKLPTLPQADEILKPM